MSAYIHPCPPSPSQGWDDLVPSAQPTCCMSCELKPSLRLCNSADITAKHVALRRADMHGRRQATADGGAPEPASPVSREKSFLHAGPQLSLAVSGRQQPPTTVGGSKAEHING